MQFCQYCTSDLDHTQSMKLFQLFLSFFDFPCLFVLTVMVSYSVIVCQHDYVCLITVSFILLNCAIYIVDLEADID